MRHSRSFFESFSGNKAHRVDIARFIDGVTATINDVVDAAMDGMFDVMEAVPFTVDDVQEQLRGARDCYRGWRWQDWKDNDDPAEAMR